MFLLFSSQHYNNTCMPVESVHETDVRLKPFTLISCRLFIVGLKLRLDMFWCSVQYGPNPQWIQLLSFEGHDCLLGYLLI